MRQIDSPKTPSSAVKRNLLRTVLGGILLVGTPIAPGVGLGCSELSDAQAVKAQNEKLMSVKAYLEENNAKLRNYSALSPEAMAQQAGTVNTILLRLMDEMKKAKSAAEEVARTGVRFNPLMFDELEIVLTLAIQGLSPSNGKINRLNDESDRMSRSRDGWGIYNTAARSKGVNPEAVMYMSYLVDQLRKILVELRGAVMRLEKVGIDGCSNNSYVDGAISEKFGAHHCEVPNSLFCKSMKVVTPSGELDTARLNRVQAASIQRKLISYSLLGNNEDDGNFGGRSKVAYSKALQSKGFNAEIEACLK